jgi:cation transport regulator
MQREGCKPYARTIPATRSNMPYASNDDLPLSVRAHLPEHAQDIFREAFNHALAHYGTEQTAFRVAWAAVHRKYEKNAQGDWQLKLA